MWVFLFVFFFILLSTDFESGHTEPAASRGRHKRVEVRSSSGFSSDPQGSWAARTHRGNMPPLPQQEEHAPQVEELQRPSRWGNNSRSTKLLPDVTGLYSVGKFIMLLLGKREAFSLYNQPSELYKVAASLCPSISGLITPFDIPINITPSSLSPPKVLQQSSMCFSTRSR